MIDLFGEKVGIVAGKGDLPRLLIAACTRLQYPFFVLALERQTDPQILQGIPHEWVRIGSVSKAINVMKSVNVTTLVFAGGVKRPSLLELKPDLKAMEILAKLGSRAFGDDGLLQGLMSTLEEEGFKVVGAHHILNDILSAAGAMTSTGPQKEDWVDIQRGFNVAKKLGAVDVGQSVVVQKGFVLGVEAVEGTDALLSRVPFARSCVEGLDQEPCGGILVKALKPEQEERMDMPTIGLKTVELAAQVGLKGIVLEAQKCLILNKKAVLQEADHRHIFIYGAQAGEIIF